MRWTRPAAVAAVLVAVLGSSLVGPVAPAAGDWAPSTIAHVAYPELGDHEAVTGAIDPVTGRVLTVGSEGTAIHDADGTPVALPDGFPTDLFGPLLGADGSFYARRGAQVVRIDATTLGSTGAYDRPAGLVVLLVGVADGALWHLVDNQGMIAPRYSLRRTDLNTGATTQVTTDGGHGWLAAGDDLVHVSNAIVGPGAPYVRIDRLDGSGNLVAGTVVGTFGNIGRRAIAPDGGYAYLEDLDAGRWVEVALGAVPEATGRTFVGEDLAVGPGPGRPVVVRRAASIEAYAPGLSEPALVLPEPSAYGTLRGELLGVGGAAATAAFVRPRLAHPHAGTVPSRLALVQLAPDLGAPTPAVVGTAGGATVTVPFAGVAPGAAAIDGETVSAAPDGSAFTFATPPLPAGSYPVAPVDAVGQGSASDPLVVVELGPFATVEGFLARQTADVVGRAPTSQERSEATSHLAAGGSAGTLIADLVRSRPPTGRDAALIRLYAAVFQRPPDTGGYRYWLAKMAGGTTLVRVAATFAGSPEFRSTYGSLGNGAFIDLVYEQVLGRSADPGGRAYWLRKLSGGTSRGTLVAQFTQSSEHVAATEATVQRVRLVLAMFDRMPSSAELDHAATTTLDELAQALLTASQYQP